MIGIILGLFSSWVGNLVIISFYFIEAIILTITYNKVMPQIADKFNFPLPWDHVNIWFTWGVFILIHFVGRFISMITPKLFGSNKDSFEITKKPSR